MKKLIFLVLYIFICLFFSCSAPSKAKRDYSKEKSKSCIIAEKFIRNYFTGIKYLEFEDYDLKYEYLGDRKCFISSSVIIEDLYDVEFRYFFKVWLKYKEGDWEDFNNWILENIKIGRDSNFLKKETLKSDVTENWGIDDIKFFPLEVKESAIRLQTQKKLSKEQMIRLYTENLSKYKIIMFCLYPDVSRGTEYATINVDKIFMFSSKKGGKGEIYSITSDKKEYCK